MNLCARSRLFVLSFLMFCASLAFSQDTKFHSAYGPLTDQSRDQVRREQWFRHGRVSPGQSSAALRYRAHRQKMQLRALPSAGSRAAGVTALPRDVSTTTWKPLGPAPLASDASGFGVQDYGWVAGRATAVAIDPADGSGNTVYVGGAFGGVWKSQNAGSASANPSSVSWTPLTDNQPTLAVGSIAIQPQLSNPDSDKSVILVGTGETNSSSDSYYGLGILRSADAGATWTLISQDSSGAHSFAGLGFSNAAATTHSAAVQLIVGFNFALNNNSPGQTVHAGQTASYNLDAVPLGNGSIFPADVSLSCSDLGVPPLSTCSFTPNQVPSGSGDTNVLLSITTIAASSASGRLEGSPVLPWYQVGFFLPGIVLALGGLRTPNWRRKKMAVLLALTVVLLGMFVACGGGNSANGSGGAGHPGTSAGNYTITVNGVVGSVTRSAQVVLTVQ